MTRWGLLGLGLAAVFVATPVCAAELLANGSAETPGESGFPLGWETNNWGDVDAVFTWLKEGHDGARAMRVQITKGSEGDGKWWSIPTALKGARELRIGDRYRADVETSVLVRFIGDKKVFTKVANVPASPTWAIASGVVKVPGWATSFRVMHVLATPGTLDTDSWSARELDVQDVALPPAGTTPTVSIAFDDGWRSANQLLMPLMKQRDLRGTHFLVPGYWDDPSKQADHLDKDAALALLTDKNELASHSQSHQDLTKMTTTDRDADLAKSKDALKALGADVAGFAAPYSPLDDKVIAAAKQHFAYARTSKPGINTVPYATHQLLAIPVDDTMSLSAFAAHVIDAAAQSGAGGWVIFVYERAAHQPPNDGWVRPSAFAKQLDYLLAAKVDVRPIGDVLGVWKPTDVVAPQPDTIQPQSFDQPDAVGKATGYKPPTREVDGCASFAAKGGKKPGKSAFWLLTFAITAVIWRRRTPSARAQR